jgi:thiol:disulfide interchange protein DsbC
MGSILQGEVIRSCLKGAFLTGLSFFIISIHSLAYPFNIEGEGCGTDCIQCHKIEKDEASEILKDFVEKVIDVKQGPVKGMWMVEVEAKGKRFPVYLHYSKKYFFAGSIIDIENKRLVGGEVKPAPKKKVDVGKIPLDDAIVMGNPMARKTVIIFDDPDCPYCRKLHGELKKIVSERKDIAFYIKLFPLVKLHPDAYRKSKSIVCERSLKLLDDAFSGKEIPPPTCETNQVDENIQLGRSLGITGTPTLILQDGTVVSGYTTADRLIALIDSVSSEK